MGLGERFEPPGDVRAGGCADAGLREQVRKPRADVHVAPGSGERVDDDATDLLEAIERRLDADALQVVVLHEQVPARGDRVPQGPQHRDTLGQVVEQQPRVHDVKRRTRDRLAGGEVDSRELALAVPGVVQHRDRLSAQGRVDVHPQDVAGRPDALGHQPHRLARTAAGIQTARARRERDLVEQPAGRRLPHPRLRPQPLVLRVRTPEHIAVVSPLGLDSDHRGPPSGWSSRR